MNSPEQYMEQWNTSLTNAKQKNGDRLSSKINLEDLESAMLYFFSAKPEHICIMVPSLELIVEVKRTLRALFGDPDRSIRNTVFYDRRSIEISSTLDERGHRPTPFYVGYSGAVKEFAVRNSKDLLEDNRYPIVGLLLSMGLCEADVFKVLRDTEVGLSPVDVVDIIRRSTEVPPII